MGRVDSNAIGWRLVRRVHGTGRRGIAVIGRHRMERVHRMRRADETFEASSWDAWTRTPLVQPPNGPRFELFVDFKRKDQAVSFKGCKYPVESGKILRSNVFCSFYWPLSDRFATRNSDDGNKKKRARPTKRLGEAKKTIEKKPKKIDNVR